MSAADRADRLSRIAKGCRWLDVDSAEVWEVDRVFAKAVRLVSVRTGITCTIYQGRRLATAKGWRPLRGIEFRRSFEICRGSAPIKLSRGRLPSAKALRGEVPRG